MPLDAWGWGRVAGFTAGWLLAVSHLQIQYSRIALNNIETVWFTILLIFRSALAYTSSQPPRMQAENALDRPSPSARKAPALTLFIVAGLVIGLGQYFYYGSRLLPLLAAVLLFALWRQQKVHPQQVAVLIVAMFVAYFPLGLFYSHDYAAFINRVSGVSIFTPVGLAHSARPPGIMAKRYSTASIGTDQVQSQLLSVQWG